MSGRLRRLTRAVVLAGVTGLVIGGLGFLVTRTAPPLAGLDQTGVRSATAVTRSDPALLQALLLWQEALQPWRLYIGASLLCLLVWWRGRRRATSRVLWCFVTMMLAWNIALDVKELTRRARPLVADPVSSAPGYSFPSGHAANAAAAMTALVVLLWPSVTSRTGRVLLAGGAGLVVVLTALDRVFLGVHYPTDVVGGVLLGCGLVAASYAGYVGWRPPAVADRADTEALTP